MRRLAAWLFVLLALRPVVHAAEGASPVEISVDAAHPGPHLEPIWRFFGADEPNYATQPDGRKLLGQLGRLDPRTPTFFRAHSLLTSGDGTPALKWGSTGAYGEDGRGRPIYDWTTWRDGMNYPGSAQLGLGKRLLEQYPWARFEPHPEWVEAGCFAAGVPGEVRIIYLPRRGVYNWNGPLLKQLEGDVAYRAFYFNPVNGSEISSQSV